jgi:DNA-binding FrmR family transcriptional regulator
MELKRTAALSAHIARIEGQLVAVRDALERNDCSKAARTLMAASRSLASVRALCATTLLEDRVYAGAKVHDEHLLDDVRLLIKA